MPDRSVVERIDAWAAAGLIDEPTAGRLRAAEDAAPVEPVPDESGRVELTEPQ